MQAVLVLIQEFDELIDSALEIELDLLAFFALIDQADRDTAVEERQFTQPSCEHVE